MKKTIAILLVAVLALGSVFAGFSGKASVSVGYDFEKEDFGFKNATSTSVEIAIDNASVEKVGEGEIYASIKATLEAKVLSGSEFTKTEEDRYPYSPVIFNAAIKEAKIKGDAWYVSILGMPSGPDFAKSAVDSVVDVAKGTIDKWGVAASSTSYKAKSYQVAYAKAPGLEVGYNDYVLGLGFYKGDQKSFAMYAKTPEYAVESVNVQAAAVVSKKADASVVNAGLSAKASYAQDDLAVSVASDIGFAYANDKFEFANMDVAANATYSPVSVDLYYQYEGDFLSAKATAEIDALKLTLAGKDLINKQDLSLKAEYTVSEALEVYGSVGYGIDSEELSIGAGAKYTTDLYVAAADVELAKEKDADFTLGFCASISSDVIVSGATLKLEVGDSDLANNLLDGKLGSVTASATIKF